MDNFIKELKAAIEQDEKENILKQELTGDIEKDKYAIDSDSAANYFCKLVKENEEEINKINKYVDDELEQIRIRYDNYRNEQISSLEKQNIYYKNMLEMYTHKQLEGKKKKSIKLPYGTLQIRKQQPEIEYNKEALEWLEQNKPEYINITQTKKVDRNKIKKDGFISNSNILYIDEIEVPGVTITERPDKFEVK